MYTIYGYDTFNVLKIVATAEELGIDYEYVVVDLSKRENHEDEHKGRHPMGKVPALDHDGNYVFESATICRYLSNTNGNKLYSDDALQAAHINQMMDTMSNHLGRWMGAYFWQEVVNKKYFDKGPDAAVIEEAKGWLDKQFPLIESALGKATYLCGEELSIADIFAYCYFTIHEDTSISLDDYPSIQRWYKLISDRPAIQKAKEVIAV